MIKIMNVKYSPNLGDGLLCECLEREIERILPSEAVASVDLAARQDYDGSAGGRALKVNILNRSPRTLRRSMLFAALPVYRTLKWSPYYAGSLVGARHLVLGGGNLLSDIDLNFPIKIEAALHHARRLSLPVHVYGVGVSSDWTGLGERLFRRAFSNIDLRSVTVRDERSRQAWDALLGDVTGRTADIAPDPGFLAAHNFARPTERHAGLTCGLGVMSFAALAYHGYSRLSDRGLLGWYLDTARRLIEQGMRVVAFSNGSPEDTQYLLRLQAAMSNRSDEAFAIGIPQTPIQLAATIASLDVIAAHRMHAIITAYAYEVPAISLAWDTKIEALSDLLGQPANLMDVASSSPREVVDAIFACQAQPIDQDRRSRIVSDARSGVERLCERLLLSETSN